MYTTKMGWNYDSDKDKYKYNGKTPTGSLLAPLLRVLIKCRQPAKKPATWRFEPSTFWGNRVKLESESLKLPTALSYQAAYFNILAVYLKN